MDWAPQSRPTTYMSLRSERVATLRSAPGGPAPSCPAPLPLPPAPGLDVVAPATARASALHGRCENLQGRSWGGGAGKATCPQRSKRSRAFAASRCTRSTARWHLVSHHKEHHPTHTPRASIAPHCTALAPQLTLQPQPPTPSTPTPSPLHHTCTSSPRVPMTTQPRPMT